MADVTDTEETISKGDDAEVMKVLAFIAGGMVNSHVTVIFRIAF